MKRLSTTDNQDNRITNVGNPIDLYDAVNLLFFSLEMYKTSATDIHEADPDVERPEGHVNVRWIGSVEPNNAEEYDEWINTA